MERAHKLISQARKAHNKGRSLSLCAKLAAKRGEATQPTFMAKGGGDRGGKLNYALLLPLCCNNRVLFIILSLSSTFSAGGEMRGITAANIEVGGGGLSQVRRVEEKKFIKVQT